VDWDKDLLMIAGIDDSHQDKQADQTTLKRVDQYFNQCSLAKTKVPKSTTDYPVYPIRLLDPDINLEDAWESLRSPPVAPIVEFVNKILSRAIQQRTQEVRLVPLSTRTLIRFNRGNSFYKPFESPFPQVIMGAMANRIRLIAGMTLMARNKPVMGKIRLRFQEDQQEKQSIVIVYTCPSTYGESLMLKGFTSIEE
jgi:type II secretory ATPase GspE/PulE/Tfp pilus assembly ATPase PilB-like protein